MICRAWLHRVAAPGYVRGADWQHVASLCTLVCGRRYAYARRVHEYAYLVELVVQIAGAHTSHSLELVCVRHL